MLWTDTARATVVWIEFDIGYSGSPFFLLRRVFEETLQDKKKIIEMLQNYEFWLFKKEKTKKT